MKKIKGLFKRDYDTGLIYDEYTEGTEWVQKHECKATKKFDGTACMVKDGKLYKRYDVKQGRTVPAVGIPCEESRDKNTGHWPWWIPVGDGPDDQWHREAFSGKYKDGTYELCGPKIGGNKEKLHGHVLILHGGYMYGGVPVEFDELKTWFMKNDIEGIVWHHLDGRMIKIKRTDFGLKW